MECSLKAAVIRLFKIDVFLLRGAVTKRDIKVDQSVAPVPSLAYMLLNMVKK